MNNARVDVLFMPRDGLAQGQNPAWVVSKELILPRAASIGLKDIGKAVINSVCAKCPLKGTLCTPTQYEAELTRTVAIQNKPPGEGSEVSQGIPVGCSLEGSLFQFDPNNPADSRLLTPTELAALPSANPTDADLQAR